MFFVVDKVDKKEFMIVYCIIEIIVADYSSKPMKGALFEFQRNAILGIKKEYFGMHKA